MSKLGHHKGNHQEDDEGEEIHYPEEIEILLNDPDIPESKKEKIKTAFVAVRFTKSFSGPLPPPEVLAQYDDIINDGAERIFKTFENQTQHRIEMEKNIIPRQVSQSKTGQMFGFILVFVALIFAFVAALYGHDGFAIVMGSTTIVGIATVFVLGKINQNKGDED